jgi:hypothetical protein
MSPIDPTRLARVAVAGLHLRGETRKRKARKFLRDLIGAALEGAESEAPDVIGFKVEQGEDDGEFEEGE